ncbi:MAG: CRISPR-associated endoribonuclease Cas6 [Cyanobacteria bacterium P01_H01_bin.105]
MANNSNGMPESLVINLVSESTIPFQYLRGHHLHRLFLALISAVDVDLSQSLQTHKRQAFSLNPLQISSQSQPTSVRNLKFLLPRHRLETMTFRYTHSSVSAGSHCWWRMAFLDDILFAHISPRLERVATSKPWFLGPARLHVTNFLPTNMPEWTSCNSYQELYEQASDNNRHLTFQLMTPAVFCQNGEETPLPTCDAVFHSLRKRWNRYSGLVFAPDTVTPITAKTFNLHTVKLSVGNNETVLGCLGQLTFQISGAVDPLIIKRINALASFSRYSGIGHKTFLGLGMVGVTATK